MSTSTVWEPLTKSDPILTIAEDLFATMVDGEPGHLVEAFEAPQIFDDPRFTWVDVCGDFSARVVICLGKNTGDRIARVMFALDDEATVTDADFADAVGELVNVVGGNVKSLVAHPGALTLPVVSDQRPALDHATSTVKACLTWKGEPICVGLQIGPLETPEIFEL